MLNRRKSHTDDDEDILKMPQSTNNCYEVVIGGCTVNESKTVIKYYL